MPLSVLGSPALRLAQQGRELDDNLGDFPGLVFHEVVLGIIDYNELDGVAESLPFPVAPTGRA